MKEALVFVAYWATVYCGWRIMRRKNRVLALVVTIALPFLGFVIALLLDARCRYCRELMSMAASVCPHCGRNVGDGAVTITDNPPQPPRQSSEPKSEKTKIVYDPNTHEYIRKPL